MEFNNMYRIKIVIISIFFVLKNTLIRFNLLGNQSNILVVDPKKIEHYQLETVYIQPVVIDQDIKIKEIILFKGKNSVVESKFGLVTFEQSIFLYPYFHTKLRNESASTNQDNSFLRYLKNLG
jgi:hypothetical protein